MGIYGSSGTKTAPIDADPVPVSCSPASSIAKSSRIRFVRHDEDVQADVVEFRKEFRILDERGRPLVLSSASITKRPWHSVQAVCSSCFGALGAICILVYRRACGCCGSVRAQMRQIQRSRTK